MKFLKISLVLSALFLFFIACGQTNPTNTNPTGNSAVAAPANNSAAAVTASPSVAADEFAATRKIYAESCVRCHKEDGTGGITEIDGRKIKAPNLTSDRQKGKPDADYIEIIENGAKEDGMPGFKGKISDEEIKNLVKYIRRDIQKK